jgi:hypothetical protein
MDPTDIIGVALGTAVACSPLVLLAYRRSDNKDDKGILASFNSMLVSTAPLVILCLLHVAVVAAGALLVSAHWSYLLRHGEQTDWWYWAWIELFLILSYVAVHRSSAVQRNASVFARALLVFMALNLIAFLAPFAPNENRRLLSNTHSLITLHALVLPLLVTAGMRLRSGIQTTEKASSAESDAVQVNLRLQRQVDEALSSLGVKQALYTELEGERNLLGKELADAREREAEMVTSLDQYQLKLAGAEVERNRLDQELKLALDSGQEVRKQLEIARMVQDATTKSVGEERTRIEQELLNARTREKELLATMERLSLAVNLLRRRAGKSQPHVDTETFNRSENAEAYYAHVLGMNGKFSQRALKERHRELVMQNHPDRVEAMDPAIREFAEVRMKEVNEAYQYFKRKMGM